MADERENQNQTTIVVKRYSNRKLYNTNESRYATLNDIAALVKSGKDVKIVDHKTKKDITEATLAQIIFEKEKDQKKLSKQALKDIIQNPGEHLSGFFQKHIGINQIKEEAERIVEAFEQAMAKRAFTRDDAAKLIREVIQTSFQNIEDIQRKIDERIRVVVGPVASFQLLRKEIDALNAQVDFLEEKIKTLESIIEEEGKANEESE